MYYEDVWRRKDIRLKCNMPLLFLKGTIRNLSYNGAFVSIRRNDSQNYEVGDSLALRTKRLSTTGEVTELNGRIIYKIDKGAFFRRLCFGLKIDRNNVVDRFIDSIINKKSQKSYGILSRWYEAITSFISFNCVLKIQRYSLKYLRPKDKVLIAGCGGGKFASEVAKKDVILHCLDISSKMINETKKRIGKLKQIKAKVDYYNGNVLGHNKFEEYDALYLNYILNVFSFNVMLEVLRHNLFLIRRGGLLIIADEKPVSEFILPLRLIYWPLRILIWAIVYCLPTKTPLHNVYNYKKIVEQLDNFNILEIKDIFAQRVIVARRIR